jgi:hypothetical protein
MKHPRFSGRGLKFAKVSAAALLLSSAACWHVAAQTSRTSATRAQSTLQAQRPHYRLKANIDWELLTFKATGDITVPVRAGDSMRDVVFFIFANAGGVGGTDASKKNIAVDNVTLGGTKVLWKLDGPLLRVQLPQAQSETFTLNIAWHGVVPRSPAGGGTIIDMLSGSGGGDLGGLLGGLGGGAQQEKPKNVDYGLYTYGNGILSLGSFWYPSLAVRQDGKWIDEKPEGLGDVAYAEMSDYQVQLDVPTNVRIAAPGATNANSASRTFNARNIRDFAVLMSDQFVVKSKRIDVAGQPVVLESFTTQKNAAKADKALDIAEKSLQIFSRRFGRYPYQRFVVAEAPMRAGAGGMEYSGMTGIASMLYQDWGQQLNQLSNALTGGLTGGAAGALLGDLEKEAFGEDTATPAQPQQPANDEGADNPATDFIQSTLGKQKAILDTLLEATIAHEVAHQWWAIGVGSDSIRAPWVDESLTNYSAMIYFEDRYGREQAQQMIEMHLKTPYSMGRMLGNADAPVNWKTSAYNSNVQYGAIVYGKGALFYDALRHTIGDEAFFLSLREYYANYNNRLARSDDLLRIFQKNAPAKAAQIRTLYKRWIEETHGDEDITGGKPLGIEDLLGGMLGGGMESE